MSKSHTGKFLSENHKQNISKAVKQIIHRPDIRKKHIEALHHSRWLKVRTDKGQLELLNKWNNLGFNFEPNYQIHIDKDLFYVDGYDPIHNIVLEYDGKYHIRRYQKEKDLIRQQKIIEILKPKKFWRYDAVTKTFRNVLKN
jgi:very-short-patch-repair endonuclease